MVNVTERYCKDRISPCSLEGIHIINGDDKTRKKRTSIEALSVSFEVVGHDYIDDGSDRFEFYHTKERIPFDLSFFNEITNGGSNKTRIFVLGTGGKSFYVEKLYLMRDTMFCMSMGAEERIAERLMQTSWT